MKIRLRSFKENLGKEHTFTMTTEIERLHKVSNDNGFRVINLPYKNLTIQNTKFSYHIVHKYNTTKHYWEDYTQADHI
jgi:hypothetical protein